MRNLNKDIKGEKKLWWLRYLHLLYGEGTLENWFHSKIRRVARDETH